MTNLTVPWMFHAHVYMCMCVHVKLSDAKQKLDLAEFQNTSKCSGKIQYVISGSMPKPFVQCCYCHSIHLYWGDKIYEKLATMLPSIFIYEETITPGVSYCQVSYWVVKIS